MSISVPIGEFSRMTHLSVKALRHYQEVGLLAPAEIDPATGYRRYTTAQVPTALLIGRLRGLDLPLPDVRRVLASRSTAERDAVIAAHLERMEHELERTRAIVSSLRELLVQRNPDIDTRELPPEPAMSVTAVVAREDIAWWCGEAFATLYSAVIGAGVTPTGPGSATYASGFFTDDVGEVTAFVPVPPDAPALAGIDRTIAPAGRFAVATHIGPFRDLDRTYGALGVFVAAHFAAGPGPIRERYLVGPPDVLDESQFRTEVCWPLAA